MTALTDRLIDAQLHERLILYLTIYLVGDKIMVFIVDFFGRITKFCL